LAPIFLPSLPLFAQGRADWMKEASFGVMTHFLAEWIAPEALKSPESFNALADRFDAEALAARIHRRALPHHDNRSELRLFHCSEWSLRPIHPKLAEQVLAPVGDQVGTAAVESRHRRMRRLSRDIG